MFVDEVEEAAHHPQQPGAQRSLPGLGEPSGQVLRGQLQRRLVEALLAREVVVHQGARDARGGGDLVDGDLVGRAVAEQFERDVDQLLPPLLDPHPATYPGSHTNTLTAGRGRGQDGGPGLSPAP
ncbi:hypothetical protein M2169_004246 [Streptomyces sp. MJP52]|nr:hypothetical protein [Streptomyces sp. MJP52]